MSRVHGDRIALNRSAVADFFEGRARNFDAARPLTATLYQDANPEIAEMRDALERARIEPLLRLTGTERVLDVGCGIGRWAAAIKDRVAVYHGIDASPSLVEIARGWCVHAHVAFHAMSTDDLTDDWLGAHGPFDRIVMSGILIYLEDEQVTRLLGTLVRHLAPGALIYLREPMGIEERLTLVEHWSEELGASYNAIYRACKEILVLLERIFASDEFLLTRPEPLFGERELNNRAETRQYFCFVEKVR